MENRAEITSPTSAKRAFPVVPLQVKYKPQQRHSTSLNKGGLRHLSSQCCNHMTQPTIHILPQTQIPMPLQEVFWLSTEFLFILHFLAKVKFTDTALYLGLAFKIKAEEAPLEGGWGKTLELYLAGGLWKLYAYHETGEYGPVCLCVSVCVCECEGKRFIKEYLRQRWNKVEKMKEKKIEIEAYKISI